MIILNPFGYEQSDDDSDPILYILIIYKHKNSKYDRNKLLWNAAKYGNIEAMKILIKFGSYNPKNYENALNIASLYNQIEAVKLLLHHGPSNLIGNIHNKYTIQALNNASYKGNIEIMKLLRNSLYLPYTHVNDALYIIT